MQQSLLEKLAVAQLVKNSPDFMKPEMLLLRLLLLQKHATVLYP
jgi:hypothetical protein